MTTFLSSIFIYEGSRISPVCAEKLSHQLQKFNVHPSRIVRLNDISYLQRELKADQGALIIPGALDSFSLSYEVCKKEVAERIRSAVERGWSYLGSCAGANLSVKDMLIDMPEIGKLAPYNGTASEIGVSFLDLLPVNAAIPVYPIRNPNSLGGQNGRTISVETPDESSFIVYWNEGSSFKIFDNSIVKAEAYYSDISSRPIAAVSGHFGKGPVFSLAIHPELTIESSDRTDSENRKGFVKKMFEFLQIIKS